MSDLISRNTVMDWLKELKTQSVIAKNKSNNTIVDTTIDIMVNEFINFIVQVPNAYDVDNIVEQLESKIKSLQKLDITEPTVDVAIKELQRTIEIVKGGLEE